MSERKPNWREDFDDSESAIAALKKAMNFVSGTVLNGPRGRPGEVIQRLMKSEHFARAIRRLRSDDISEIRQDQLFI